MSQIIILYTIVLLVNIFVVFNFFVRLVAVETRLWSTSFSVFQIINILPRVIGVFQIPLITLYTESAINDNTTVPVLFYQGVIFFNFVGLLFGAALLPYFSGILREVVIRINSNSSFKSVISSETIRTLVNFRMDGNYVRFFMNLQWLKIFNKKLLVSNIGASFLLCIAFPACVLIGNRIPEYRATFISFVSFFYGVASVITILFIDTKLAMESDKAFHGERTILDYKLVLIDSLKGKFIGTFLALITLSSMSDLLEMICRNIMGFKL